MNEAAIQPSISVALVTHVWTPEIQSVFERLQAEAPPDHAVRFLLSADAEAADPPLPAAAVVRISREDLFRLPYPRKCHDGDWVIAGNLDLVFLEYRRRLPRYEQYWFIEYDVHFEGNWRRLFEHFRASQAGLLGAIQEYIAKVPHKLDIGYPHLSVPAGMRWNEADQVKGFYPLCRLSAALLDALDADYRAGLGGHYEIVMPSVALRHGLGIEDFGGNGSFVQPQNRDRFYFANAASYSHSPGNFVFRPGINKVLKRENTLWHPVKPQNVPLWYPLRFSSANAVRNYKEMIKRQVGQAWIRWWFATRWRPLK
jgi:hypothetical protein